MKKSNVVDQEVSETPAVSVDDHTLEVVQEFTYLRSTITSNNISLNVEINKRNGKAAPVKSVQEENNTLTKNTKACVLCTLLYGGEAWTT